MVTLDRLSALQKGEKSVKTYIHTTFYHTHTQNKKSKVWPAGGVKGTAMLLSAQLSVHQSSLSLPKLKYTLKVYWKLTAVVRKQDISEGNISTLPQY